MLGLGSWQLLCEALIRQTLSLHTADAVSLLVCNSATGGGFPCREEDWSEFLGMCDHMTYTWSWWGPVRESVCFFHLSWHICTSPPTHPHTDTTLHPHPTPASPLLSPYTISLEGSVCLHVSCLWKDCKELVTATASGKRDGSWEIGTAETFRSTKQWSPHLSSLWLCCSVAKSCLTLCNPMDCSTSGSSVLCYLLEFAQIHIHWVSDAISPSHPLPPPSPFGIPRNYERICRINITRLYRTHRPMDTVSNLRNAAQYTLKSSKYALRFVPHKTFVSLLLTLCTFKIFCVYHIHVL